MSIAAITFSHYVPSATLSVRNAFSSVIVPIQKGINNIGMIFVRRAMNSTDLKEANERIKADQNNCANIYRKAASYFVR